MELKSDPNSLWLIKEAHGEPLCEISTPIKCGQKIRLQHVATGVNLHSHLFTAALSKLQEVSGFGDRGNGLVFYNSSLV